MRRFSIHLQLLCLSITVGASAVCVGSHRVTAQGLQLNSNATPSAERAAPPAPTEPLDLTVSPVSLQLNTNPGEPVRSTLRVLNNSSQVEYLSVSAATFSSDETGSRPIIREFTVSDRHRSWLSFPEQTFRVQPGEWKSVPVVFSPPPDAALSYYYAVLVTRTLDAEHTAGESVITGAPAVLALATVNSPHAVQELQLVSFQPKRRFYEYLPAEFEVRIKNTGNVHTGPFGDIFIKQGGSGDVALLPLNPGSGLILPGSERSFPVAWKSGFPSYEPVTESGAQKFDAAGNPVRELRWDLSRANEFRIGKYTAQLFLVYSNGERDVPIEAAVSFWVIPWRILLLAATLFVLIGLGIFFPIKALWKSVRKKR